MTANADNRFAYAAVFPDDLEAAFAIGITTPNADTAETVAGWIRDGAIVRCVPLDAAKFMFDRWLDKPER